GPGTTRAEAIGQPLLGGTIGRREGAERVVGGVPSRHLRRVPLHLAQTEIEDLHELLAVHARDEEVLGLEVAMNDADHAFGARERVRALERSRGGAEELDRACEVEGLLSCPATARDELREGFAFEPLEREKRYELRARALQHAHVQGTHDGRDERGEPKEELPFRLEAPQE